jgi:ATP/maltotriose-dependent transcriptional regulator MalT
VQPAALDDLGAARLVRLRGQIAFDQLRCGDAAHLLTRAARMLEPLDAGLARMTHLDALGAAMWVGERDGPAGIREVARAALAAPVPPGRSGASDLLLDGFGRLVTEGYAAAGPSLRRALELMHAPEPEADDQHPWLRFAAAAGNAIIAAQELWDAEAWGVLSARQEQFVRDTGALRRLQFVLNMRAWVHVAEGDLTRAALSLDEARTIAEATGNPPFAATELILAAARGESQHATELIEAMAREASARALMRFGDFAAYGRGVLYNGQSRHAEALEAIRSAVERDHAGYGPFLVPELVEAAARTGDAASLSFAREWLTNRTAATPSDWSAGIETRLRALVSDGETADAFYRRSIDHLRRTRLRPELARAHLIYGEWLRRQARRSDARGELRKAHQLFTDMGMAAFAERARIELVATGEKVRKRSAETRDELTAQEEQIAVLARDGLSSREIGARLFLSPRTVEWHLGHVFRKLGIRSRRELSRALPTADSERIAG